MRLPAKFVALLLLGLMAAPVFATCLAMPVAAAVNALPVEPNSHPAGCHGHSRHALPGLPSASQPSSTMPASPAPQSHRCCISAHNPAVLGTSLSGSRPIRQLHSLDGRHALPISHDAQLDFHALALLCGSSPGPVPLRI